MAAPRFTFLYPHLFRRPFTVAAETSHGLRPQHPLTPQQRQQRQQRQQIQRQQQRGRRIHTSVQRRYEIQPTSSYTPTDRAIPLPQPGDGQSPQILRGQDRQDRQPEDSGQEGEDGHDGNVIDVSSSQSQGDATKGERGPHVAEPVTSTSLELSTRPLERVLHMDPPTSRSDDNMRPHMKTPPYVHHFDTFSLVHDLQDGGFSQQQSISLMKAVRGLLATNMQLARDELVSKSDIENAQYLFRAACSELRTEVQNSRRTAAEKMRSERGHLQYEVEILSQRVAQETGSLKDELKGQFDDRKMTVRMEQREMESKIQELNYKIQSVLTGQAKGEVEGLRWFLTRRAAIFIGGLAVSVIVGIQYSVHTSHLREQEIKRLRDAEDAEASMMKATGAPFTTASRSTGTQTSESTDALLASMDARTSQNYVSLG